MSLSVICNDLEEILKKEEDTKKAKSSDSFMLQV